MFCNFFRPKLQVVEASPLHLQQKQTKRDMKTTNRREGILSKTEYDIMSIIWDVNRSVSAREIYDLLPEPQPAYTTLANEMRMLYEKGFVDHFKKDGEGKTHHYIARIGKAEYVRKAMHDVKRTFFGGSLRSMLSYFIREEEISEEELINFLHEMEAPSQPSPEEEGQISTNKNTPSSGEEGQISTNKNTPSSGEEGQVSTNKNTPSSGGVGGGPNIN